MTPTLYDTPTMQAQMMRKGTFDLMHAWALGDGFALEYWRGTDNNGACLRTLIDGDAVSVTHYAQPGAAIRVLLAGGYPVPGVAPIATDPETVAAMEQGRRQLRAHLVTHRPA